MSEYVTLLGAEDVNRAAHRMTEAAAQMQQAAYTIENAFTRHQQFMDDWLLRLGALLSRCDVPKERSK